MMRLALWLSLASGVSLQAQLISNGSPIPRRDKPPVVFLNGYQSDCGGVTFAGTFGPADQVMQADGRVSLFFNNCDFPNKPVIETLGAEFGKFLSNLKYEDGQPVEAVDVVAHSMGGLIVRSYLSGKQQGGAFNPPAAIAIRKALFIATPQFGTGLTAGTTIDPQVSELTTGSAFLYDLATWNQGTDDLRGVDALAMLGNAGTGLLSGVSNFDDGVVSLMSGSIQFALPGRTRILPLCHTTVPVFLCGANPIAVLRNATDPQSRIVLSFLNGTNDWQTIGTGIEADKYLSANGGVYLAARGPSGVPVNLTAATADTAAGQRKLTVSSAQVGFSDLVPAGTATINGTSGTTALTRRWRIEPGVYQAMPLKQGPWILRVFPAGARVWPLSVAPGMFVSIYGDALASGSEQTPSVDFPLQLADAQVLVNSAPAPLHFASAGQINAVMPENAAGRVSLKVQNGAGSHTVNVMVEPAVPSIFTQNGSGSGPASALNARNSGLVTEGNALRAGDYLMLYLTGLGATTRRDGLDWANQQPTVTIGGVDCAVSYAGRAPGYRGLDQINCRVPEGLEKNAAAPVLVKSGARVSNAATVAVE